MNKARERQAINDLKKLYAEFPSGAVAEGESPDFIVGDGDACVGIEVCEYFRPERPHGAHPMEQEALKHRIVDRASQLCADRGQRGFLAPVTFTPEARISKVDVESLASAIVNAIGNHTETAAIQNNGQRPECIDDIYVYFLGDKHDGTVTYVDTTWLPPLDLEELTRIIMAKESKLSEYRKRCSTIWLLIIIDGFRLSSVVETPDEWPLVPSAFDRVLILHDRRIVARVSG